MGNQPSYDEAADSILVEAWGGSGGSDWNYKFKGPIKEILINHAGIIDSIMFKTVNNEEIVIDSPRFGGNGGRQDKVVIEGAPYFEYLRGIKGTLGNYGGHFVVKSLSFITNVKNYGPIGPEGGTPFSLVMKEGGAIVGFHGRCGVYLDAIGVYLQHVPKVTLAEQNKQSKVEENINDSLKKLDHSTLSKEDGKKIEPNKPMVEIPKEDGKKIEPNEPMVEIEIHEKMDVMKTIVPRNAGPWGGCSGKGWDDGIFCTIKQVHIYMDRIISAISGIQIEYEKKIDKTSFWSQLHGGLGAGNDTIRKVIIDGENEFLIGIEGYYSPVKDNGGLETIRQIAFYTNKRKYGPYGIEIGTYFSSSAARGKIVGFHGKSGVFLNAIGVHMEYF